MQFNEIVTILKISCYELTNTNYINWNVFITENLTNEDYNYY